MHGLRGNYILFFEKLGTTSYGLSSLFSYVSAKLRNALPDFIVPMSLLVLKENPGPRFVQRLFFLINISLKIYLLGRYLYMLCILAVNVMSPRY